MVASTGVVDAMRGELEAAGEPVLQPSLFPASQVASLPAAPGDRRDALTKRGAGRPAGARNRRTDAFRDYVLRLSGGEHPVEGLIEAYQRPVHILAEELGCSRLDAFKAQQDARRVVLEYVEGKMPVSVNLTHQHAIPIIFEGFDVVPGGPAVESEYIQEFSSEENGKLEQGKLEHEG
jgi:hypothetical protein